ncbi:MAG TPA: hypothetical protein VF407_14335 [Polyangiaceae bacterium]
MKRSLPLCMVLMALSLVPAAALAANDVSCVSGQFAGSIEGGKPQGDASAIASAHKATYFVDVSNPGAPTQVTLVWKLDGKEVQRQSLDVGTSSHWHTWGSRPIGNAQTIDVELLDPSGASLKTDSLSLASPSAPSS